jgi:hypothetical protein
MSTERTIGGIKEDYGRESAEIANGYQAAITEIAAEGPESIPNLEYLNHAQVHNIILEQKMERARERYQEDLERGLSRHNEYRTELGKRTQYLEGELFKVEGDEGGRMLSDAARASDEQLSKMLQSAIRSSNRELGRVVFGEAESRKLGDLMARYCEAFPEAREFYNEWRETPTEEELEYQRESIERIIRPPTPERLTAPWAAQVLR